ncbi:hypothetical protein M3M33_10570 [Loigolactobacillus coryniformis]|nr:hypothetical protein [Loigolactobacillus coryniformis]MCL5459091.1 hypothetical protein [Loigolactobacillus coryniformis]
MTYLLKELPQQPDFADPAQLAVYLPWHYPGARHQNKKTTDKHQAKNAA